MPRAMYHPTTRVLTVLEVLQARGGASGADLAARLEVDARTVRRYITMLQQMGIRVEARPGWHGATTTRPFDPYAMVCATNAAWYAVGHCHLRGDVRLFRLDRVARVEPDGASFVRPADFDALGHVRRALALLPAPWSAEIALD